LCSMRSRSSSGRDSSLDKDMIYEIVTAWVDGTQGTGLRDVKVRNVTDKREGWKSEAEQMPQRGRTR
jgi:hypothetical protein